MNNKTNNNLLNQVAALESQIDHYETELAYLDCLLKQVGFSEGISTLKSAAFELIEASQTS